MSCIDYCSGGTNVDDRFKGVTQTDNADTTDRMRYYEELADKRDINSDKDSSETDKKQLGGTVLSCTGVKDPTDESSHAVQGELFPKSWVTGQ